MDIQKALGRLAIYGHLSTANMRDVMHQIMRGDATPAQIGAFLMALRMKGETVDEIAGAVSVMRELVTPVEATGPHLIDTCGTGGDGADLFNVSTASAFVAAAAGAQVAKHGNRSVSSTSGSSDVLLALGVSIDLTPAQVAHCLRATGMGFMFAPAHHSALRHALAPRRELGLRTIFNLVGPMTNPAGVKRQVMGVFLGEICSTLATVLGRLGSEHVLVVHSVDGLDEISLAAATQVAELRDGDVREYTITPESLGVERMDLDGLAVRSADESVALIRAAFGRDDSERARKARAMIKLNAGAAIYVAGLVDSLHHGVALADDLIASGQAREKLETFVQIAGMIAEEGAA
jgi:anthranilate phosphoribosyltransferase